MAVLSLLYHRWGWPTRRRGWFFHPEQRVPRCLQVLFAVACEVKSVIPPEVRQVLSPTTYVGARRKEGRVDGWMDGFSILDYQSPSEPTTRLTMWSPDGQVIPPASTLLFLCVVSSSKWAFWCSHLHMWVSSVTCNTVERRKRGLANTSTFDDVGRNVQRERA